MTTTAMRVRSPRPRRRPPAPGRSTSGEFDAYIGLTVAEATTKAEDEGRPARVVEEDGESLPVTMDFNEQRLNFVVVDGKVTEVSTG